MNNRPRSVTVISWIFITFGGIALLVSLLPKAPEAQQALAEFRSQHPLQNALMLVGPALAVICGAFMLLRFNWARWLLVAWFGSNVLLGVVRFPMRFLVAGPLFGIVVYFLFRPQATAYFRGTVSKDLKAEAEDTRRA